MKPLPKLIWILLAFSCSETHQSLYSGKPIFIEAGKRVVNIEWHDDDMWIHTEPMDSTQRPRTLKLYQYPPWSRDSANIWKITIVESSRIVK